MNSHDTYRYHRERLGYSHNAAKMIATGGLVYWTRIVSVSAVYSRRDRFRRIPALRDRPHDELRASPAPVLYTRALLRKKMPVTDSQLDVYLAFLRDTQYVGTLSETRRRAKLLIRSLNPRLSRESQLVEHNGWVARANQFVTTVSGIQTDAERARPSTVFPGGYTIGPPTFSVVTVHRRRLKIRFMGLTPEEVEVAGFVPLREALRGKHLTDEMIETAFSRLRVGRVTHLLTHLFVDPAELEAQPSMLDAERVTLIRIARRESYHGSGVGRLAPPSGATETYGFEWELVAASDRTPQAVINRIDPVAVNNGVLLGYERDSSLRTEREVEVVSSPQTLDTHLAMLQALPSMDGFLDNVRTDTHGGIHIHVGRTAFRSDLLMHTFGMLFSLEKNWDCTWGWEPVAGRVRNNYVRSTEGYRLHNGRYDPHYYHDRYTAANIRERTVEVRIFRSSVDPADVARALRVVATAVAYVHAIASSTDWLSSEGIHQEAVSVETFLKWAYAWSMRCANPERYLTTEELEGWFPRLREESGVTEDGESPSFTPHPLFVPHRQSSQQGEDGDGPMRLNETEMLYQELIA